jgi:site-specific DNA recombinase
MKGTKEARRLNCAIYTRKSTEEGLDQDYNSLDAQRDACENFVTSQKSEGWLMLRERYDDGGYSGGTMNRPGLQQLLDDVREGRIDIIVVYKIDRLSRSLSDFAKLVDLFDEHKVTFVSVTQSFNTTTSMGRLTLNILLSFAQFERELSGERVRDKFAASRKRGMWMGGMLPLGYDLVDRKLVINEAEACTVREIFKRFATLPSMAALVRELRSKGVTSKSWTTAKGVERPGRLVDKGYLYKLINNPVYIGIAVHKGNQYPGEHEAIVDQETWETIQEQLSGGAPLSKGKKASKESKAPSLLRGLLYSADGNAFTPGWTAKGDRYYRYYINTKSIKEGKEACDVRRIPAGEIETVVIEQLRQFMRSPEVLSAAIRELQMQRPDIHEADAIDCLKNIEQVWDDLFPPEQARIAQVLIHRIAIKKDGIRIEWKPAGIDQLLGERQLEEVA